MAITSSASRPSGSTSSAEMRMPTTMSSPTGLRTAAKHSTGSACRFSRLPPKRSVRRLVAGLRNCAEQQAVAGEQLDAVEPGFGEAPRGVRRRRRSVPRSSRSASRAAWCGSGCRAPPTARRRRHACRSTCRRDTRPECESWPKIFAPCRWTASARRAIAGDAVVVGDDQLGRVGDGRCVEARRLDDDQAGAALRPRLVIGDEVVARQSAAAR